MISSINELQIVLRKYNSNSKIAAQLLLCFDSFKESFKVPGTETLMVSSLNNFKEESRTVLDVLGEDLKQVTLFIVVDEDL